MATKRRSKKSAAAKTKTAARKRVPAKRKSRKASLNEYSYRGKAIRLEAAKGRNREHLMVDGRKVSFMRTDEGVTSHASMYMVYGSPFELGEALVRQWGESQVDPEKSDPGHDHGGMH